MRSARVVSDGEVRAGAGLAEQLAPLDLAAQRRRDPALLLLLGAVDHQRRERPAADHRCPGRRILGVRGTPSSITSCSSASASRPHGFGHCGATKPASAIRRRCSTRSSSLELGEQRAAAPRGALRLPAAGRPRAGASRRRARAAPTRTCHARRRAEQRPRRHRAPEVHVRVVLPGEADAAERLHAVLRGLEEAVDRRATRRPRAANASVSASPTARAASHVAARASSVRATMLAQRCFTPWNCPIGRPNWRRSFAYSARSSTHHCDPPTASAANSTAARSRTDARRQRGQLAARGHDRVGHRDLGDPPGQVDAVQLRAPSNSSAAARPRCRPRRRSAATARCPDSTGRSVPLTRSAPSSGRLGRERRRRARPRRSASRRRARDRTPRRASLPAACSTAPASTVARNGPGRRGAPELLEHDRELGDPVALAAVLSSRCRPIQPCADEVGPERRAAPRPRRRAAPAARTAGSGARPSPARRVQREMLVSDPDRHAPDRTEPT